MLRDEIEKILDDEYGDTSATLQIMLAIGTWTARKPLGEDGYPLEIGDAFMYGSAVQPLIYTEYHDDKIVLNGLYEIGMSDHVRLPEFRNSTADGFPIKPGRKYYNQCGSLLQEAIYMRKDIETDTVRVVLEGGLIMKSCDLFKNKPVRDADGEVIRVGDTVWLSSEKLIVDSIDEGKVSGKFDNVSPEEVQGVADLAPSSLTHREPDSLEKLRDDIIEEAPNSPALFVIKSWADRLTALIERGAK